MYFLFDLKNFSPKPMKITKQYGDFDVIELTRECF
jgi:hypothetical protein